MIPGCIVILGATNDSGGALSPMAIRRLRLGLERFCLRKSEGWKILLTGGFGAHFNTSLQPHAEHAKTWLMVQGVPLEDILEPALSGHTIDDAIKAAPILEQHGVQELDVVTSDFHLQRAETIFRIVFTEQRLHFFGSSCLAEFPADRQTELAAHEADRVAALQGKSREELFLACA